MPALERCLCCGLHQGSVIAGNYAIIVYGAAMGLTLWWIVDNEGNVPVPAYAVGCLYFIIFIASVMLVLSLSVQLYAFSVIHGFREPGLRMITVKKPSILLTWLLIMSMFLLPECGLNMWISIFILGTNTGMGLGFLVFYVLRAVTNVLCMICIHALYVTWQDEETEFKEKIATNFWKSLYGDSLPPYLMWNVPGMGHNPMERRALPAPNQPLMLTYPGFDNPYGMGGPVAPPRKMKSGARMVSAGEYISCVVEDPETRPSGSLEELPPSRDSAIGTSEKSFNSRPNTIYDPIKMPLVPHQARPPMLALPWHHVATLPRQHRPSLQGMPQARMPQGMPQGMPQPLLMPMRGPVPMGTMGPPMMRSPMVGPMGPIGPMRPPMNPVPMLPPGMRAPAPPSSISTYASHTLPPRMRADGHGASRFEPPEAVSPPQNPIPMGSTFDVDPNTEPGFENFLLKNQKMVGSYKPKSIYGEDDTGYYSRSREGHVIKRNPIGGTDYYPPPRPTSPPPKEPPLEYRSQQRATSPKQEFRGPRATSPQQEFRAQRATSPSVELRGNKRADYYGRDNIVDRF